MTEARSITGRGRCLCGAVRYTVHGPLRERISACHCHMCRRHHGGIGYYTAAARDDVEIADDGALRWYVSSPGVKRGFCGHCGSTLFFLDESGPAIDIAPGSFDEMPQLKVDRHIYVAHKGDYYMIADGLPQYDENVPKKS